MLFEMRCHSNITHCLYFVLFQMTSSEDCITLVNLLRYLQEREKRRITLEKNLEKKRKYCIIVHIAQFALECLFSFPSPNFN